MGIVGPTTHHKCMSVRGLVVMIVACQVMDPGSIPGERSFFFFIVLPLLTQAKLLTALYQAPLCDPPASRTDSKAKLCPWSPCYKTSHILCTWLD